MFSVKRALFIAAVVAAAASYVGASGAGTRGIPACPGHAPKQIAGAKTKSFVKPGATAMRLCRYYGNNWGFPYKLMRQRLIRRGASISSVTHTFNGLGVPPKGIFCMRDDDSKMLVVFSYQDGSSERVLVKLTGCPFTTNGRANRWATPRLQHRLLNLVKGR